MVRTKFEEPMSYKDDPNTKSEIKINNFPTARVLSAQ